MEKQKLESLLNNLLIALPILGIVGAVALGCWPEIERCNKEEAIRRQKTYEESVLNPQFELYSWALTKGITDSNLIKYLGQRF